MTKTARLVAVLLAALLAAPAFAQLAKPPSQPVIWECKVERRIESGHTTMYDDAMRAKSELRLVFVADVPRNRGCLLDPALKNTCGIMFTGAAENGGMLRLDMMDEHQTLDLVNIFPSTGRFLRIHGDTQWIGKQSDCLPSKTRKVKLP